MHEITYRKAIRSVGVNAYFFEMANIREQCSWVHPDKGEGTKKAMELVASAVAKVSLHEPLEENEVSVTPRVLVIGGGIAGIQASLDIAHSGFEVYLVEKSPSLGGHLAQLDRTFPDLEETSSILLPRLKELGNHPLVHLVTYSEVEEIEGFVGNFKVTVSRTTLCQPKCNPQKVRSRLSRDCSERTQYGIGGKKSDLSLLPLCRSPYLSHRFGTLLSLQKRNGKCREVCPEGAIQFEEVG
jgi:heterodisulfide reductase subunit A